MSDNPVFDIPKCKVRYMANLNVSALFVPPHVYTGPRYQVTLVDGINEYWAGEYPPSEYVAAVANAHRIAKRAQANRYRKVSLLLAAMEETKE